MSQIAKENTLARFLRNTAVLFSPHRLRVRWYDQWHPLLDEALASLPEMQSCPHELFRLLIQNPTLVRKRVGLVTEQGTSVAIVGLRQKGKHSWEPVTQWIIPGAIFPAKPGYLIPALETVGSEVWVAWWRMGEAPSPSRFIRYIESTPTYRADLSSDYERYWRRTSHYKTVVQNRNRCRKFTFAVNLPGSAEWTINNWEAKWRTNPAVADPALSDRIVAAKYLESQGRYFTLSLLDQGVPIGGATLTVHGKDLVAGVIHRDPKYDWYGVGVRLIDLSFSFAAESGFERLDLGGGHEYKKYWAPQEGERWWFNICPEPLFRAKQVVHWVRGLRGKTVDRASEQVQI